MSTLRERARKWGEERDQLWLQRGIEQERQRLNPTGGGSPGG